MSDQAQPAAPADNGGAPEGQGQAAPESDALYNEYVADHPEELRPFLVDVLRKQDAKITPKLQEAAAFRQRFEPFSQIEGFDTLTPEDVSEFIAFRNEILADPEALGAWMGFMAQENEGVLPAIPEDLWAQVGVENGWLDAEESDEDASEDGGPPAWFQQYQQQQEERLAPILQTVQEQRDEQRQGQVREQMQARLQALEAEHGELDEAGHAHVVRLAHGYLDTDDPIGAAFEEHMRITGKAIGDRTDEQLARQNGTTLRGSAPDTSPPQYAHDDPDLRKAALARFRG